MKKILAILFLFTAFFTFSPEVFAVCNTCTQGTPQGNQCLVPNPGGRGQGLKPQTPGCPVGQQASTADLSEAACQCVPSGTTGATGPAGTVAAPAAPPAAAGAGAGARDPSADAAAAAAVCAAGNCTGGKGLQCNIGSGDITANGKGDGIMTAIGCVPSEPRKLIERILQYGTMASGVVAFLIMILASLQMITAEGNPQNIKGAQEKFYSAIIGLLFIIFAVLLLQVIGVDLLGLKGFTR